MGETWIGHTANCAFLTCYTAVKVKFITVFIRL